MEEDHWNDVGTGRNCTVRGILDMDAFELQVYLRHLYSDDLSKAREIYLNTPCILVHPKTPRIIAVNYCAKSYGISREDNCREALIKCPQVKVVKKESRLIATGSGFIEKAEVDHLIKSSQNVLDAFVEYRRMHSLSVILENVSNDETYFDMTEEVDKRIRKQIVDTRTIGPNTHMEGNRKYKGPSVIYRYHRLHTRNIAEYWDERRLIMGGIILEEFRTYVFEKVGLEASGGVGLNKLQAKLACPLHKPGGMTILIPTGISRVAKRIPVDKLPSLGGLQGSKLKQILGERLTMFDLSQFSAISLARRTGLNISTCQRLNDLANGICYDEVKERLMKDSVTAGISNLRTIKLWSSNTSKLRFVLEDIFLELVGRLGMELTRNARTASSVRVEITLNPKGHKGSRFPKRGFTLNSPQLFEILSRPEKISKQSVEEFSIMALKQYEGIQNEFLVAMILKVALIVPSFISLDSEIIGRFHSIGLVEQ